MDFDGCEIGLEEGLSPTIQELRTKLAGYNSARTGKDPTLVSLSMRARNGELCGGTFGWAFCEWFHIEVLWVSERRRGQGVGRQLIERLEQEAMRCRCSFLAVQTATFQAPGFYRKLGFEVFATLGPVASSYEWQFMRKTIARSSSNPSGR
jgi:ribosomal protein S18 acetylase RimI-like enzyme